MTKPNTVSCPACAKEVSTPRTACIIEALYAVLLDRGNVDARLVKAHFAACDPDDLWNNSIGPVLDWIEDDILAGVDE